MSRTTKPICRSGPKKRLISVPSSSSGGAGQPAHDASYVVAVLDTAISPPQWSALWRRVDVAGADCAVAVFVRDRHHAKGRYRAGDRDRETRVGVGSEMQSRVVQFEPVGLDRYRLVAAQQ